MSGRCIDGKREIRDRFSLSKKFFELPALACQFLQPYLPFKSLIRVFSLERYKMASNCLPAQRSVSFAISIDIKTMRRLTLGTRIRPRLHRSNSLFTKFEMNQEPTLGGDGGSGEHKKKTSCPLYATRKTNSRDNGR